MSAKETAIARKRRYESKRDFAASPEPSWTKRKPAKTTGRTFVVHKHAARRLHYDLRLEIDGALASWAVPKGFPVQHGEKHLAVKVEDHPLDYGNFEGNIPAGNYGAGAVMLWDRGLYEVLEDDPAEAVRQGHLSIVFAGEKLTGHWILVRTGKAAEKEQWLLIKGKENDWQISAADDDRSVLSGRSLNEIAATGENQENPSDAPSAPTDLPPAKAAFISPMKPHLAAHLPRHGKWIYEIKFDGYRVVAVKSAGETRLFSRNHIDVSNDFPAVQDAVTSLPANELVLDGEVVALLESGIPSFQLLQNRRRPGRDLRNSLFYYAFDLLNLNGHQTSHLPLQQRKQLLQALLKHASAPLRFSAGIDTDAETFLSQAEELGLEGLIAKEADSRYQPGRRSRSWLKIKVHHQQEFVIGGYTRPKGTRSRFGSVIVGIYKERKLHYVARVGTGFDEKLLEEAYQKFQPLRTDSCPFVNLPTPRKRSFSGGLTATEMKTATWLKPKLVCEIRFSEWTDDDSIRHPVFLGFRDDKNAREVRRETPV